MNRYLIIYHREDNDGVFSGALFYDYLVYKLNVNNDYIDILGVDYGELLEYSKQHDVKSLHETYSNIIMVDISVNNVDYMKHLHKEFGSNFIWCDHHAPIIKESHNSNFGNVPGVRNIQKSAILCTYEYLYDQLNEIYSTIDKKASDNFPELLRILSAYDSWSFEREGYDFEFVRNVNKGVTVQYNLDFNKVLELVKLIRISYNDNNDVHSQDGRIGLNMMIDELYAFGKQLNDYDDQVMENIIKTSGDCSWKIFVYDEDKGRPLYRETCVIFHQGASNSQMFKVLKKTHPEVKNGMIFKHNPSGQWTISLYNVNDDDWFHCGEYLKKQFGGGGHKGAAGATISEKEFIKILQNKAIYDHSSR